MKPLFVLLVFLSVIPLLFAGCTGAKEPEAGQSRTDEKGVEQVWVPAGSFMMGTDEAVIETLKS